MDLRRLGQLEGLLSSSGLTRFFSSQVNLLKIFVSVVLTYFVTKENRPRRTGFCWLERHVLTRAFADIPRPRNANRRVDSEGFIVDDDSPEYLPEGGLGLKDI